MTRLLWTIINLSNMETDKYLSPKLEVVGIIVDSVIMDVSGQGTIPENPNIDDNG